MELEKYHDLNLIVKQKELEEEIYCYSFIGLSIFGSLNSYQPKLKKNEFNEGILHEDLKWFDMPNVTLKLKIHSQIEKITYMKKILKLIDLSYRFE